MGVAVRHQLASLNRNLSAEIFADEQSKSSFAACFRTRLIIFTIRGRSVSTLSPLRQSPALSRSAQCSRVPPDSQTRTYPTSQEEEAALTRSTRGRLESSDSANNYDLNSITVRHKP